jgi:hypothetical protein
MQGRPRVTFAYLRSRVYIGSTEKITMYTHACRMQANGSVGILRTCQVLPICGWSTLLISIQLTGLSKCCVGLAPITLVRTEATERAHRREWFTWKESKRKLIPPTSPPNTSSINGCRAECLFSAVRDEFQCVGIQVIVVRRADTSFRHTSSPHEKVSWKQKKDA